MAFNETAKSTVILDGKQAEESLKRLQTESKDLRTEIEKLRKANDLSGFEKLKKEVDANTKAQAALKKELFSVEKVMQNLSGASMNQLKTAQRSITAELNKMTRGTQEYIDKSRQLKQVNAEIGRVKTELNGASGAQQGFFNKMSNGFNKYFGLVTAFAATFTGVVFGIRKAIDAYNVFEKSLSTLSSLTGLQGDNLKWLGEQAKTLSTSTTESGIKITSSATDIVEAYKLMGSARPELLQNKEDLNAVTKQALILKEAAGIELNEAVQAVASSMNQFNLGASESERVINVLAAGALVGSSEISDLTGSMKNVGSVAKDSNMSLEQTVAALEVLGSKALKGEEAGTKLRGSILKMKEAGLGYASGQFVMSDALEEANKKIAAQGTAIEQDALKIKLFGAENVTTGTILLNNVELYKSLTTAVTGTDEATKQAAINTNNNAASLEQAKNKANIMAMTLGEKLAPALTFSTNGFSYLMKVMLAVFDLFKNHGRLIITVTSALIAYTVAVKLQTLAQSLNNKESTISLALSKAKVIWDNAVRAGVLLLAAAKAVLTGNITRANAAMVLFNQTTKLNPFGMLLAVIAAVVVGLAAYSKRITDVSAAQKIMIDLNVQAQKSIAGEKLEIERLLLIARDEKRSKEERLEAIKALNTISPEYLGNLTLENINTKDATKATEEYIKVLEKKALIQAAKEKLIELEKEFIDLKNEGTGAEVRWYQTLWNSISSGGSIAGYITRQAITGANNIDVAFKELAEKKKALMGILTEDVNQPSTTTTPSDDTKPPTGLPSKDEIAKANQIVLDELEKAYNQRRLLIIKTQQQSTVDQDWLDQTLLANEIAYFKLKEEAVRKSGKDTLDLQIDIANKEIDLTKKIVDEKDKANKKKEQSDKEYFANEGERLRQQEEDIWNQVLEEERARDSAIDNFNNQMDQYRGITDNMAASMGEALGTLIANNEASGEEFAKVMILTMLDALHMVVRMSIAAIWAQSLAQPDSVATFGATGIARAITISAIAEAAFGVVKAIVNASMNNNSGGGKTRQRYSGKYDVIGADDGRGYSVGYGGPMRTGIYGTPTLVAERGDEVVIDGATTRNLRVNFPDVLPRIMAARVPQRAEGNYTSISSSNTQTPSDPELKALIRQQSAVINALTSKLNKGINAKMSYTHMKDGLAKGQAAEDRGSRNP